MAKANAGNNFLEEETRQPTVSFNRSLSAFATIKFEGISAGSGKAMANQHE
jgi:hypothetical protein